MTNKGGRPTDFIPEVKEKILVAIKKGAPYELACNYAGICYNTLINWKKKAENEQKEEYVEFFKQLKEAEGYTALIWLDKIDKAMNDGVWQAAAWKLERRHYKHFSTHAPFLDTQARIQKIQEDIRNENERESEETGNET